MKAAFPELRMTCGFVVIWQTPEPQPHWWLVDPAGDIVDPTLAQFGPVSEYREIDEAHPARHYPRVKCMNCGSYFIQAPGNLEHSPACSRACSDKLAMFIDGDPPVAIDTLTP